MCEDIYAYMYTIIRAGRTQVGIFYIMYNVLRINGALILKMMSVLRGSDYSLSPIPNIGLFSRMTNSIVLYWYKHTLNTYKIH